MITTTTPTDERSPHRASPTFADEVARLGFTVEVHASRGYGAVVTVATTFTPGDVAAYATAETSANYLLSMLPMTYPGTVWGTDGRSVGGHAGLTGGYMRLSKSGVGTRPARAAAKALGLKVGTLGS